MLKKDIIPSITTFNFICYTNEQIEQIISTLNTPLKKKQKSEIISKLNHEKIIYQSSEFFFRKPMPTLGQMQKEELEACIKVNKAAERLIDYLQGNKVVLELVMGAYIRNENRLIEKERISKRINKLIFDIKKLTVDLEIPIKQMAQKNKDERDDLETPIKQEPQAREVYRQKFVLQLMGIYEDITGKKVSVSKYIIKENGMQVTKYNSPGFRFIKACFEPIEIMKDGKLKEIIIQARKISLDRN